MAQSLSVFLLFSDTLWTKGLIRFRKEIVKLLDNENSG